MLSCLGDEKHSFVSQGLQSQNLLKVIMWTQLSLKA